MRPDFRIMLVIVGLFLAAACSRQEDKPGPGMPVPSDPAVRPAPSTAVPAVPSVPNPPDPRAPDGPAGRDSKASNPKGDLTSQEESTAMPKAGQANNHSSPSLDSSQSTRPN